MSETIKVNEALLKNKRTNFVNENNHFDSTTYRLFLSSYFFYNSDSIVLKMRNNLEQKYQKIKRLYNGISTYFNTFILNIEGIEQSLSNNGRTGAISEGQIRNIIDNLPSLESFKSDFYDLKFQNRSTAAFANQTFSNAKSNANSYTRTFNRNNASNNAGQKAIRDKMNWSTKANVASGIVSGLITSNRGFNSNTKQPNPNSILQATNAFATSKAESLLHRIHENPKNSSSSKTQINNPTKHQGYNANNFVKQTNQESAFVSSKTQVNNPTKHQGYNVNANNFVHVNNEASNSINAKMKNDASIKNQGRRVNVNISNLANPDLDKDSLFKKMTMEKPSGVYINYDHKEIDSENNVCYYDKDGRLLKKIFQDGTVEIHEKGGTVSIIVYKPDGTEEYYDHSNLKRRIFPNGITEEYYSPSDLWPKEYDPENLVVLKRTNADGSYTVYTSNGAIRKEGKSDGSYVEYSGGIATKSMNAEGIQTFYREDGTVSEIVNLKGDREHYTQNGKLQYIFFANGGSEYYSNSGKLWLKKESNGNCLVYNPDGTTTSYSSDQTNVGIFQDSSETCHGEINLGNGKTRIISSDYDYIYDSTDQSRIYTNSDGSTYKTFSESSEEFIQEKLKENGLFINGYEYTTIPYSIDINYDRLGNVTSATIIETGSGSKGTTIVKSQINKDGSIDKTELKYDHLKDGIKSYNPKDLLNNPDNYIDVYSLDTKTIN